MWESRIGPSVVVMEGHRVSLPSARPPHAVVTHRNALVALWVAFSAVGLLLLGVVEDEAYGLAIAAIAGALAVASARLAPQLSWDAVAIDRRDLAAVGLLYAAVVGLLSVAFLVFTTDRTAGLFISFALGLLLGVIGPVVYTARRGRPLSSLGLGAHNWRATLALGLLLAGIQFALTLNGYDLPAAAEAWVPLLLMSLVVGVFESVFFRGFVQGRLEASFGIAPAVAGAAALYALYHVGYGMGPTEIVFLLGLGIVYAVAYRLVGNLLVLWPLLTPLGSFYNNVDAGDIELPWASVIGFGEVLAVMLVVLAFALRRERRRARATSPLTSRSTTCRSPATRSTPAPAPATGSPARSTSTPSPPRQGPRASRPPSSTSPPEPAPPGTPTPSARRSTSPKASASASAAADRSRSSAPATASSSSPARTTGTAPHRTAS